MSGFIALFAYSVILLLISYIRGNYKNCSVNARGTDSGEMGVPRNADIEQIIYNHVITV